MMKSCTTLPPVERRPLQQALLWLLRNSYSNAAAGLLIDLADVREKASKESGTLDGGTVVELATEQLVAFVGLVQAEIGTQVVAAEMTDASFADIRRRTPEELASELTGDRRLARSSALRLAKAAATARRGRLL